MKSKEAEDIVVFIVRRDTDCSECGQELWHGSFLRLENRQPLCLSCADLDHLEFLPRGDAALTRRSTKHSKIHAVVVQWSRTRKRYERQGILAEPEAIERAMEECLADAELREARREREALRREEMDQKYIDEFAGQIRKLFPKCPPDEEQRIAAHACRKYSRRVGRSKAAKELDPEAVTLAVRAHIRHMYTNYDELLMGGWERWEARDEVQDEVEKILNRWRGEEGT
ncbi:MAG: DUF2293 domain-containing protein [bacterium]